MTDRDPMLDSVPTYNYDDISELEFPGANEEGYDAIKFVLLSDLPALIARIREDEREKAAEVWRPNFNEYGRVSYEQGREDAAKGVEALTHARNGVGSNNMFWNDNVQPKHVVAAARGSHK